MALRCLIVDDNDEFLDSASRLLSTQGLETHSENELAELIVGSLAVGFLPKEALGANAIVESLR